ncbi:MAG TPA: terminase [Alphaproteobacteria bacterium]|nr:terminase [Alphaproteobacteria bacterium]
MSRHVTRMTIDDAEHYTPEQRAAIIASYPLHEREARVKGLPSMGSGRVFPVPEEQIVCAPFAIPDHWAQIAGIDFGWDHPTAAARLAWDRDSDTIYVVADYSQREATPLIHAAAIKAWGEWIPVAWPHDGLQHDKQSGETLADAYRKQKLKMLSDKATFEDGGNGVEAGVMEMLTRMQTGRWKVFSNCGAWLGEFRLYHRIDGIIEAIRDDVLSASRYAMMMKRYAVTKPALSKLVIPDYGAA